MEYPEIVLRVAIVDDDPIVAAYLKEYAQLNTGVHISFITNKPDEGLRLLEESVVDLLFLDLEMPGLDGLQFATCLNQLRQERATIARMQIVICSGHAKYPLKAFDHKPMGNIVKPVTAERFLEIIQEARQQLYLSDKRWDEQQDAYFMVHAERGREVHRVDFSSIIYLEAHEQQTRLWLSNQRYFDLNTRLKQAMPRLPEHQFFRIHRSYAININYFKTKSGQEVSLHGTEVTLPIGKDYPALNKWLTQNIIRGRKEEEWGH